MFNIDTIKKEIVDRLKPLNPEKVILFGSYAWGNPNEDSDVDLYVVTKDDFLPNNWHEKSEIYLRWIKPLSDIQEQVGIDLITHTKPMHSKFVELNSMFYRKIIKDGVVLI